MNPAEFENIARSEREFWWYRGMREILFRALDPVTPRGRETCVLEAGCGTGYLSQLLAARYGWRTIPLDLDARGLEHAASYGLTRLVQGDVARLPFGECRFDAVLSMDVIVHFERGREQAAFDEIARVLKPGGIAAIRVSALDALRSRHSEFAHERQRFTRRRLLESARAAGLIPSRCTYLNALLLPVAWFKFRVWEPLTNAPPKSGVTPVARWLDSSLYAALALEANWIASGGSFPLGQSLLLIATKAF